MRHLICYDIEEDKVRARLVKLLEAYGVRIQYSVFEFNLSKARWTDLKLNLKEKGFLDGSISIVIYPLSAEAYELVERYGAASIWDEGDMVFD
ncbi:MAG: CRISPR-associated endonuclease Cas2 [Deltaproteobacteria bacterium RIFCSPLOWO2_12_FULL_43_16]|nr:MAG: CRISPR-associated endonuclease Cas2 [Deltaproteobacteria bacterium GWA2_43_19]OGQ11040.1 MAG: CRISPR-associated endonuclease Cas2 [Deltaproteobacteria bacterium RIFCSPHIGHO2_02_FULL_43_33]OGQ57171.1 MAG: CRISPR-associated endonuclease Cas2 [Deltaproteobacteria bacterium RIFCSPLOWO2_12_FULL_43_16]HBR17945.1 CRISPR-associated endonuclease Cas2 [Deltaproteobacteria bacterium]